VRVPRIRRYRATHGENDVGAGGFADANGNNLRGGRHRFRIAGTHIRRETGARDVTRYFWPRRDMNLSGIKRSVSRM